MPSPRRMDPRGGWLTPLIRRSAMLGGGVFAADQISKWLVLYGLGFIQGLPEEHRIEVTPFLNLVMVWNRGISYGLFPADTQFERWILVFLSAGLVGLLAWWLTQVRDRLLAIAIGLIIGGALGNVVDRVAYGAVADFFQLHAFGYSWYVFNVADTAIVFGVLLMAWDLVRGDPERADTGRRPGPEGRPGVFGNHPPGPQNAGSAARPHDALTPHNGGGAGGTSEETGQRTSAPDTDRKAGTQEWT